MRLLKQATIARARKFGGKGTSWGVTKTEGRGEPRGVYQARGSPTTAQSPLGIYRTLGWSTRNVGQVRKEPSAGEQLYE
jgi:hypothetical protein